mgnify:CR=1 FL=1
MRTLLPLIASVLLAVTWPAAVQAAGLQPFVATYDAWYEGRQAGAATMRLQPRGAQWQIDLGIRGNRVLVQIERKNAGQAKIGRAHV